MLLRDIISLKVNIIEFHDMRITLDPSVESKIKTTAPSRIVRFTLNVTNFGNVPDLIISILSEYFELAAGDIILTGTPAGVGAVRPGDSMRAIIEGLGELGITVY